jgi:RNA polymerase sigma factor (sigma-70 family)
VGERSGDHTARDRLSLEHYGRYRGELIAFIRTRFGVGPPDPEDVVQQAFMNFASLEFPGRIANPRAFLYRSAYNIVLNHRKHERIGRQFLEPATDADDVSHARDDLNPEVVVSNKEQYALLEAVIRAMPAKRREYLLLNRIEGLGYAEIARRVGLSESVIRKHVALAVRECGAALMQATEPAQKQGSER